MSRRGISRTGAPGMEYLHQFMEEGLRAHRAVEIKGLENFYQFTGHSLSARMHDAKLVKEKAKASVREEEMAGLATRLGLPFSRDPAGVLNRHDFVYLRRGDNRQETNVMTGELEGCHVKIFDYSHTSALDYYSEHRQTIVLLRLLEAPDPPLPNLAVTPGHYLERYLVEYREADLAAHPDLARDYRLYATETGRALETLLTGFAPLLQANPGYYLEIRDNVLLVFRPGNDLVPPAGIESLLAFAGALRQHGKTASR